MTSFLLALTPVAVYAVAQGSLAISGFQAEGEAAKIVRGVPTVGRIANGAIIEREIEFALNKLGQLRLALRNPDFTTAQRIAKAVNGVLKGSPAVAILNEGLLAGMEVVGGGSIGDAFGLTLPMLTALDQQRILRAGSLAEADRRGGKGWSGRAKYQVV